MKQPIVSIILPVWNGARFLPRAIRSVENQTFSDWELIVVDDGSTDGSAEMVRRAIKNDARIRYEKNERNLGIQKTLNRGLALARGTYIARIDDDDEWCDARKLEVQIDYLAAHPRCVLIGTGVIVVDENGAERLRYLFPSSDSEIRMRMLSKNCFAHSSVMFRRSVIELAGAYDESESTKHVEDYELWLRMGTAGEFYNIPEYMVRFMMRAGAVSSVNKLMQLRRIYVIAREYRAAYPRALRARGLGMLRIGAWRIFFVLPRFLKDWIFRHYKEW